MKIGILIITAVDTMHVTVYAFATYELALDQAWENLRGVEGIIEKYKESTDVNALRNTTFIDRNHAEYILVRETAVGTEILPVPGDIVCTILNVDWGDTK